MSIKNGAVLAFFANTLPLSLRVNVRLVLLRPVCALKKTPVEASSGTVA